METSEVDWSEVDWEWRRADWVFGLLAWVVRLAERVAAGRLADMLILPLLLSVGAQGNEATSLELL